MGPNLALSMLIISNHKIDDVRAVTKIGLQDRWHAILQYKTPTHDNAKILGSALWAS